MWTLVLIFLLANQEPIYVSAEAESAETCVASGTELQMALDREAFSGLRWACVGPGGETVTDEDNKG